MRYRIPTLLLFTLVCACASTGERQPAETGETGPISEVAAGTATQTRDGLTNAALSPLEDFNLRRQEIPALLVSLKHPYLSEERMTCTDIATRLAKLEEVIGPDWDASTEDDRRRTDQITDAASGFALGAVESGATGWIPFRGLVRQATGAAGHEKKVARAYTLGAQQRAYLKGYGMAIGCALPARPDFEALTAADSDKIIYK